MRQNLFNTWYNSILTLLALGAIVSLGRSFIDWALYQARWEVIPANIGVFMIGTYPRSEAWRIGACVLTVVALAGLSAGAFGDASRRFAVRLMAAGLVLVILPFSWPIRGMILFGVALGVAGFFLAARRGRRWRRGIIILWILSFPWVLLLLSGFGPSGILPKVETTSWGGFTLTLLLAVVGIVASFPIGVLLALGRRSNLPAISIICTAFIEVVRGMPLVTVLFMTHLMMPIFLPQVRIDRVVRAMVGLTIFTSAYMAENVRGGLQGVPKGQYEAAQALGLGNSLTMLLIVLPQAVRSVIPSIVGQFISLFKDTSLVTIIGLLDLLGIARSVIANPAWLGLQAEVYLFAAVLYWMFSYSLSKASARVEAKLGVEQRA